MNIYANQKQTIIDCKECLKKDVCRFKDELNKIKQQAKDLKGESMSPIKVTVTCTAAVKDPNATIVRGGIDNATTMTWADMQNK